MTPTRKKWVHAGLIALVSVMTDIGAQLQAGALNMTRAVIVGAVVGGIARVMGAVLAAMATAGEDN